MKTSSKTLAGIAICIVLATSFLLFSGPILGIFSITEVPFETVDSGGGYNYETRDNYTITDTATWESLWLELYSGHSHPPEVPIELYSGHSHPPEVPSVNFTSEMLIAVFQGERGSSGYLTHITRIIMTNTYYLVYVDEIHPGENCGTLTVMTYPYHIVKINGHPLNLPVLFVYNITIHDCG